MDEIMAVALRGNWLLTHHGEEEPRTHGLVKRGAVKLGGKPCTVASGLAATR